MAAFIAESLLTFSDSHKIMLFPIFVRNLCHYGLLLADNLHDKAALSFRKAHDVVKSKFEAEIAID